MKGDDLYKLRRSYADNPLNEADMAADPFTQFEHWFDHVLGIPDVIAEPNAMVLATADADGQPSARMVLLKGFDDRGFVLHTNYTSRKGQEAAANPKGSLVFPWNHIERQVVIVGSVEKVSDAESVEYFSARPRGSQIAALTSEQSQVITREGLEKRWAELAEKYAGDPIPRPDFWGGLRVVPATVEFWQGRNNRLHDRLRYRREASAWVLERLSP
ncbi:MAG: pyridoxamine 5'-phosphate oxidase [Actinomycetes bacterium]|jgi:pyridoxamine 5'-phosphate oxidase